jgi:hypothetical protein
MKGTSILGKRLTKQGKVGRRPRKEKTNGSADKEWNVPLVLDRDELMAMLQDCLTDFATEVGLKVACLLFEKQADVSCTYAIPGQTSQPYPSPARKRRRQTQPRRP